MRRTTVGTLCFVRASDLKSKVEILRCDLFTEIAGEEYAIDVFASHLPINKVRALARPV
jgi:predicted RecB family endonuclease